MGYSRPEQETCITWDEEQKVACIYATSPISIRKLDKLCEDFPDVYRWVWAETDAEGRKTAGKYEVSSKYIRFRKPTSEARHEASKRAALRMHESMNAAR